MAGDVETNEDACGLDSLDSMDVSVIRSSLMLNEAVCFDRLEIERSPNQSLLFGSNKAVYEESSGLSCWYTNATSLTPGKLDELRAECIDTAYDVRFVSETWFNDQSIINIEGYDCFRRDRNKKRGGGVCIYTVSSGPFSLTEVNDEQLNSSNIEQVWCVSDSGKEKILLGCIYRPKIMRNKRGVMGSIEEHSKRDREINKTIYRANNLARKRTYQGMLLVGDFNFTELTWNEKLEPGVITEAEGVTEFINWLISYDLWISHYNLLFSKLLNTIYMC